MWSRVGKPLHVWYTWIESCKLSSLYEGLVGDIQDDATLS